MGWMAAVWSAFPTWKTCASIGAGLVVFAVSFLAGLAVTVFVVSLIPQKFPKPTEAYEGFGDAMIGLFIYSIGAIVSLVVSVSGGLFVGNRVASRWAKPSDGKPDLAP